MRVALISAALMLSACQFPQLQTNRSLVGDLDEFNNGITANLTVDGPAVFFLEGPVGGPFVDVNGLYDQFPYTITNTSETEDLNWGTYAANNWLIATPSAGILGPGESQNVSAALSADASRLSVGEYRFTLSFRNNNDATGEVVIAAVLNVQEVNRSLRLTQGAPFNSSGNEGGTFAPNSQDYTIENQGNASATFTVSPSESWITVGTSSNTVNAAESEQITLSINSQANSLAPGNYNGTVTITNTSDGNSQVAQLDVGLTISQSTAPTMGSCGPPPFAEPRPRAEAQVVYVHPNGDSTCTSTNAYKMNNTADKDHVCGVGVALADCDPREPANPIPMSRACKNITGVQSASSVFRDGTGDWMLMARGSVFGNSHGSVNIKKAGHSSQYPGVYSSYNAGQGTARPLIKPALFGNPGHQNYYNHHLISGLHIQCNAGPTGSGGDGFAAKQRTNDVRFEDMLVEHCRMGITIDWPAKQDVTLVGNVFIDNVSSGADAFRVGGSAVYASGAQTGFVFSHNFMINAGFHVSYDYYNNNFTNWLPGHGLYAQPSVKGGQIHCNYGDDFGSHMVMMRGGPNFVSNNYCSRAPLGMLIGDNNGPEKAEVRANVLTDSRNMPNMGGHPAYCSGPCGANNARGRGLDVRNTGGGEPSIVEYNIMSNTDQGGSPFPLHLNGNGFVVHDLTLRNNIIDDWEGGFQVSGGASSFQNVIFDNNQFQTSYNEPIIRHLVASSTDKITAIGNQFFSALASGRWFDVSTATDLTLAGWLATLGTPAGSGDGGGNAQVAYVNFEDRDHLSYASMIMGSSVNRDQFKAIIRGQSRLTYDIRFQADSINAWIREGYGLPANP